MTDNMQNVTRKMKADSYKMAALDIDTRNLILSKIKDALNENKDEIFEANRKDLEYAENAGITQSIVKRLKFNEDKLKDVSMGIEQLISLPDPVNRVLFKRQLDEDLILNRISCPIGVIGIIFESRPDALVQISSLCIKSGNCAVLKGGKETANTNKVLFNIIYDTAIKYGAPLGSLYQAESHGEIDELLACNKSVDLLIPRGSNKFVSYIMNNTKIPVMGHADGICHTYVDKDADFDMACKVLVDAKTQYSAVCNATETLLFDRSLGKDKLIAITELLKENNVKIRGNKEAAEILGCETMQEDEFNTEYDDLIISVKMVDGVDEAISHINTFGSHHTDCIITENRETAERFMNLVDSAGTYMNCSTRFADGFRYGFGAEVGISTGKIHARGPVGLEGLTTYKYKLYGKGHIVGDYASGVKKFNFKDM